MARSRSRGFRRTNRGSRRRTGSRRHAGDYPVGYAKPPVATRFKPGQSGNPKGRPKRHRNLRTILEATLNRRIAIGEGGRSRRVTKLEALSETVANRALKGDSQAVTSLITLMRATGMVDEAPAPSLQEPITDQDAALLADYLSRHTAQGHDVSDGIEKPAPAGDPEAKHAQHDRDPDPPPPAPRRGQ